MLQAAEPAAGGEIRIILACQFRLRFLYTFSVSKLQLYLQHKIGAKGVAMKRHG